MGALSFETDLSDYPLPGIATELFSKLRKMNTEARHRKIEENSVYTPGEVAWLLKIGIAKTYELLRSDKINVIRLGEGKIRPPIRVTGKELLRWINNKC